MQTQNESIDKKNEENIKDERGNIKKEILEKIADNAIARNPLIYERLAEI
jgi:hypothetical protein